MMTPIDLPQPLQAFDPIVGVCTAEFRRFADERGVFMESFRREWFPWLDWTQTQMNRSESKQGVLRGLHYHFKQVDYWLVTRGAVRVGLADLRPGSPTYGRGATLDIDGDNPRGVLIPEGVAHGFYALTDVTLLYVVNHYYDGGDEFGVRWDDPDLAVPWGVGEPNLSERDQNNPTFQTIPDDVRPARYSAPTG